MAVVRSGTARTIRRGETAVQPRRNPPASGEEGVNAAGKGAVMKRWRHRLAKSVVLAAGKGGEVANLAWYGTHQTQESADRRYAGA
jgi:hypothetical protein